MADEAFALSPIHARAALPTDADYDAIHQAFMETSRGRWFLTEYAKRNRNADTRMVLEAVERLEAGLASQKAQAEAAAADAAAAQVAAIDAAIARVTAARAAAAQAAAEQAAAAQPPPVEAVPPVDLWPDLAKAFTRARMEIAQRLVRESNDEAFETIRASTETLKSISWALRERGFDVRICDFLDIQVNKITDGCTGLMAESSVASDVEVEILATFDDLIEHVEGLTRRDDPTLDSLDVVVDAVADAMSEDDDAIAMPEEDEEVAVAAVVDVPPPAVTVEAVPSTVGETAPVELESRAEAAPAEMAEPIAVAEPVATDPDAAFREIYGDDSDIEIVDAAPAEEPPAPPPAPLPPTEPEINKQRLYEAKLEPYRISETNFQVVAPADDIEIVDVVGAEMPSAPEHPKVAESPAVIAEATPVEVVAEVDAPEAKPSLGQALLDSGVVSAASPRPDPLAPFRRMSQAEKIAFFT
jgi:hypothetical protein